MTFKLKDGTEMETSAAPTTDAGVVNKLFVDALIGAFNLNGYDRYDTDSMPDVAYDNTTRKISVAVKSGQSSFHFWVNNVKITKTTTQEVTLPDTSGTYYTYFDNDGVLQYSLNSDMGILHFTQYAITSLTYINRTNNTYWHSPDELHGKDESGITHLRVHLTQGARLGHGVDVEGLTDNTATYTQTTSGLMLDEDIPHTIAANSTGHKHLYRDGANGDWVTSAADLNVGFKESGDTYYSWNENTSGTIWTTTEGTSSTDFWHTFWILFPDGVYKLMGQKAYSRRSDARDAIETEKSRIQADGLPSSEFVWLGATITKRNGDLEEMADGSVFYNLADTRGSGGNSGTTASAEDVPLDASGFSGNLSSADVNLQLMAETVDGMSIGGSGFDWSTDNNVTTDQTPATTDAGEMYRFTSATSADRSLTLPSVGSTEDGDFFWIANESSYVITVKTSDDDFIWNSGAGYGVEMLGGTVVCVRYDHSATKWEITHKTGGMVRLEGLKLHLNFNTTGVKSVDTDSPRILTPDSANKHTMVLFDDYMVSPESSAKFGQGCGEFSGASPSYGAAADSSDWDVFGSTSGVKTIACWIYCDDAAGVDEMIISHFEDGSNQYFLGRNAAGAFRFYRASSVAGGIDIDINGGTLAQSTWYHIAAVISGTTTGIYIDGTQVAYDASFTADTFSGSLFLGQQGSSVSFFDGRMDDIIIANQNIYDAAPNSTPDDTLSNWNKQFVGVQ